jgi:hypothetical protein
MFFGGFFFFCKLDHLCRTKVLFLIAIGASCGAAGLGIQGEAEQGLWYCRPEPLALTAEGRSAHRGPSATKASSFIVCIPS